MSMQSVTILGGGNTAFAAAARLTLRGFQVTLYELPEFDASLEPIRETGIIHLSGVAERGAAKILRVTSDIEGQIKENLKALDWDQVTTKPSRKKLLELGMDDIAAEIWPE